MYNPIKKKLKTEAGLPWRATSVPEVKSKDAIGDAWRKDLAPTVTTMSFQKYQRSSANYALESLFLVRVLHQNFQTGRKGKQSQPLGTFIEKSIGRWYLRKNGKITIGFSFQVDKPPEWNSFLQSIKITCETTNEQLDQWKPVSHSKYSIGGVAKFVDKSWEQLELVAMHHCVLKYMFTFSLGTSIVGEWKDGEDFVNNVLVLVGKKRKYFLEFLFKICALYPTMQKLYEAKDTLLSVWQKQVVGEEMSDTPLLSLIDSKFKELDSSTVVTEVADLLASVTSEHAYMNLFKFDRKGLLMTYEAMTQRESTLPRNEKRRRKRDIFLRQPLPQEDIDRLWWDSLCCLAYARYLSITSDTNLKNAVHQAMGRTRAPRRKRVPAPPTAPAAGTSAAPASTPPARGVSFAPGLSTIGALVTQDLTPTEVREKWHLREFREKWYEDRRPDKWYDDHMGEDTFGSREFAETGIGVGTRFVPCNEPLLPYDFVKSRLARSDKIIDDLSFDLIFYENSKQGRDQPMIVENHPFQITRMSNPERTRYGYHLDTKPTCRYGSSTQKQQVMRYGKKGVYMPLHGELEPGIHVVTCRFTHHSFDRLIKGMLIGNPWNPEPCDDDYEGASSSDDEKVCETKCCEQSLPILVLICASIHQLPGTRDRRAKGATKVPRVHPIS